MTPRTKNIALIVGFVLMLWISYQFSISKTFVLKDRIGQLEKERIEMTQLSKASGSLKQREHYSDSVLSEHLQLNGSVQSNLLDLLNGRSQELGFSISDFKEPHSFIDNGMTIQTLEFRLRGPFDAIQTLLYEIEQQYNFGEIRNLHFEKKKDYRARSEYLECTVVIENQLTVEE
ncbi:MAG: hypothetical protein AAF466_00070 [Bacteroidota bacterium]